MARTERIDDSGLDLWKTAKSLEKTIRKLSMKARRASTSLCAVCGKDVDGVSLAESIDLMNAIAKVLPHYVAIAKVVGKMPKRSPIDVDSPVDIGRSADDDDQCLEDGDPDYYERMKGA